VIFPQAFISGKVYIFGNLLPSSENPFSYNFIGGLVFGEKLKRVAKN